MANLNALMVFAKVVEASSFSEAARRLKMPVSTVSRQIAELENELGVRLIERSTRRLRLTEIGTDLLEQARRTLDIHDTVDSIVSNQLADVSGNLRLSAPPSLSDSLLAPIVVAFQREHPLVRIEIMVTERQVDLIADGVDLIFHVGPLSDSAMVARRILTYRHRLVASPAYLGAVEPPLRPRDLLRHDILTFSHFRPEYRWTFRNVNGREKEAVTFWPRLGINDFAGVAAALLAGHGLGDLPPIAYPELVRDGRLVEVMPDWHFPIFDLSLVHLGNRHITRPLRLFKDFAAQMAPTLFPDLPT